MAILSFSILKPNSELEMLYCALKLCNHLLGQLVYFWEFVLVMSPGPRSSDLQHGTSTHCEWSYKLVHNSREQLVSRYQKPLQIGLKIKLKAIKIVLK